MGARGDPCGSSTVRPLRNGAPVEATTPHPTASMDPVVRELQITLVNLLITDDVRLGKTGREWPPAGGRGNHRIRGLGDGERADAGGSQLSLQ